MSATRSPGSRSHAPATFREIAERIVLGTTLEAKLAPPPPDARDEARGAALRLAAPGRPPGLASTERRARMPRGGLASERARAIALHRFANHELQAIELMAWALLAFPEAPAAFRAGLLATLADEQRHLALYRERLAAHGVSFGELPVNDYFWDKTGDLETPLHYVSAMGLTFEAANLDFAAAFRDSFRAAGDEATARVLEVVRRDEVEHVRFGALWLRALKRPDESEWDAWTRTLRFPLAPHRARGPRFEKAARLEAGVAPEIVARVAAATVPDVRAPRA